MTTPALFLSFLALVVGIAAFRVGKRALEAAAGVCTALLSALSAWHFRLDLIASGKGDIARWLGFSRYPFVLPVYCLLAAAGLVLFVHGLALLIRQRRGG